MKNIFKLTFLLTVSLSFCCKAQEVKINGQVLDSENLFPLPYVNIMVVDHLIGTSTNEEGKFELNLQNISGDNKVVFSNLGFENLIISVDSLLKLQRIQMKPSVIVLEEVVIGKKKKIKYKTLKLDKINKSRSNLFYSTKAFEKGESLWVPYRASEPTIEAVFFPNDFSSQILLNKIELYLSSFADTSIFRVRIYNVDENNFPNQDIIELPIQTIKKGKTLLEIKLSDYDIEMPDKGLFIGLELIMTETNLSSFTNKEGFETKIQSPFLLYKLQREHYSFYRYSKGKWEKVELYGPRYSEEMPIRYNKPAINLIVNQIKD